jgi:hypothetical protein
VAEASVWVLFGEIYDFCDGAPEARQIFSLGREPQVQTDAPIEKSRGAATDACEGLIIEC